MSYEQVFVKPSDYLYWQRILSNEKTPQTEDNFKETIIILIDQCKCPLFD